MTSREYEPLAAVDAIKRQNWLIHLAKLIIVALAGLMLVLLVWSLPRGFDITDESFYLLNYRYPVEYESSFTNFHLVIARVFGMADASILVYRIAALLGAMLGAVAFGLTLSAWLRRAMPHKRRYWIAQPILVVGYILLGELLAMSIMPRTISYNGLNTLLLLLIASATLVALTRGSSGIGWLVLAGVALGLDMFVKVSTAALVLASLLILLGWCWRQMGMSILIRAATLLALGLGLGVGLYFLRAQQPAVWWHNFSQEMTMLRGQGYGTADLFIKYLGSARQTLRILAWPLGPVLLILTGAAWWWPRRGAPARWHLPIALVMVSSTGIWLVSQAVQRLWYSTAYLNQQQTLPLLLFFLILIGLVVATEMIRVASVINRPAPEVLSAQRLPVAIWLLALPLLAAAGTYNDLRLNLVMDAAPWFGLALLLLAWPRPNRLPAWVQPLLLLLLPGFAAEQLVWGVLRVPYCLTGPMMAQKQALRAAGLQGPLRLEPSAITFIGRLEKVLAQAGFRPGDPLLAFYDMPGLVYLCGGISPGAPWYFKGIDARNCHALDITRQPLHRACILLNEPLGPEMQRCLREHGLRFPEDYRLVDELPNAWAINTYMYRSQQHSIQVYAPLILKKY